MSNFTNPTITNYNFVNVFVTEPQNAMLTPLIFFVGLLGMTVFAIISVAYCGYFQFRTRRMKNMTVQSTPSSGEAVAPQMAPK